VAIQERRSTERFPLRSKGCTIFNGDNLDLRTHDVSLGGTLVEFVSPCSITEGAKLRLYLDIGFVGRAVVCRVITYDNGTLFGLKFDRFDFYSDLVLSAYFVKYKNHPPGPGAIQ
jgi:hypothetical protein